MAAGDFHLKIDKVQGESEQEGFKDQIQIESWSWGESNSPSVSPTKGLTAGKCIMQDFHFTMPFSKASPLMMLFCSTGEHIAEVKLTGRKGGGSESGPQPYLEYIFTDCMISSYQSGVSGGEVPHDSISIAYSKVTWDYLEQSKKGSTSSKGVKGFDLKTGKKA